VKRKLQYILINQSRRKFAVPLSRKVHLQDIIGENIVVQIGLAQAGPIIIRKIIIHQRVLGHITVQGDQRDVQGESINGFIGWLRTRRSWFIERLVRASYS